MKYQTKWYKAHNDTSSSPLVKQRSSSHVDIEVLMTSILIVVLSRAWKLFNYYFVSSTRPWICLYHTLNLSELPIEHPCVRLSMTFIMRTLIKTRLVPENLEPCLVPYIGDSSLSKSWYVNFRRDIFTWYYVYFNIFKVTEFFGYYELLVAKRR